jgi:hypothetical protein
MNKKTSEKLRKLYKPFTIISFVSIFAFAVNVTQTYLWSYDSTLSQIIEVIFGYIGIAFGFLSCMGILPAIISVLLIVISIVFVVKEKNYKNVINIRLWLTVILTLAGGFFNTLFFESWF